MICFIPTCGESPHLPRLLESIVEAGVPCYLLINNCSDEKRSELSGLAEGRGAVTAAMSGNDRNLYSIWNDALEMGRHRDGATAILNDDVYVHPGSFELVDELIRSGELDVCGWNYRQDPGPPITTKARRVAGTFGSGGLGGFAFACDPSKVPSFSTDYSWWYGDDDWVQQCSAAKLNVGIALGAGVTHHTSTTATARPEVYERVKADRDLFKSRWG